MTKLEAHTCYLLSQADAYVTESPCWIALSDAAHNVINGEVQAALDSGELDDDLLRRVRSFKGKPPIPVHANAGIDADDDDEDDEEPTAAETPATGGPHE